MKFASKHLRKTGIAKKHVLKEEFHSVPGYPRGDLKVSENWIQINKTWIF